MKAIVVTGLVLCQEKGPETYIQSSGQWLYRQPVFLDREATISKLDELVARAKEKGADIAVWGNHSSPSSQRGTCSTRLWISRSSMGAYVLLRYQALR